MKRMKLDSLLLAPVVSVFCAAFAMDEDPRNRQEHWASHHTTANGAIRAADVRMNPLEEFSKLQISTLPHPEVYHLYLRDHEGRSCSLVRDIRTHTTRIVRLYNEVNTQGTVNERAPNYVTISPPSSYMPKETLVTPSSKPYKEKVSHPTIKSTSYPTGVSTYYLKINGKKIRFDQGHGIPHADTLVHQDGSGKISTKDAENYVPQNIKYNSPIRRDLEKKFREAKLTYKEISIYHNNCMYDVTDINEINSYRIPIPEGFLFIIFDEDSEIIQDTYYFPNLIDYETLKRNQGAKYAHIPDLYKIPNLSGLFFNPEVTLGVVDDHQQKVDKASKLVNIIPLLSQNLFCQLTEHQMPPKARTALLTTLLEWNVETAATLEFLTFENQLHLCHFYLDSRRNLWELDDRYEAQKVSSIKEFISDQSVSPTARKLVHFLEDHTTFTDTQYLLQETVQEFEEIYRNAPFHWKRPAEFYPQITKLTLKNGDTHEYNLATILPTDIPKLKKLIGGASNCNLLRVQHILSIIDEKARQIQSTIMDKLGMIRLYHDNKRLCDAEKYLYWERAILDQARVGKDITLLDRRRIIDFYSYRSMKIEKEFWLGEFVSYVQENPTPENFLEIANWCLSRRSAFLENLEEQVDNYVASDMLALMIYKALSFYHSDLYEEKCKEPIHYLLNKFGFYKDDPFCFVKAKVIVPFHLKPLAASIRLVELYHVLLQSLFPEKTINRLYGIEPFSIPIPVLGKKFADFKNESALCLKLGLLDGAKNSARSCFKLAKNSLEFKEAALALQNVGFEEFAQGASQKSLEKAVDYEDFIYAIEAFHKLGKEQQKKEAKQLLFQAIHNKKYDYGFSFVSAAVEFYKLGLTDLAREAAEMNYKCAKVSKDLSGAVQIFCQNGIIDMALEAATFSCEIAKTEDDHKCVEGYFQLVKRYESRYADRQKLDS